MITSRMRRRSRSRYIESYEFPAQLSAKLVTELGSRTAARVALDGLRGWYLTCLYANGELIGMPSRAVDVAWHEMILMTREYHAFCERAFGGYLHHSPDSTLATPMPELYARTLAITDRHELGLAMFSADSDAGIEDGHVWEPADYRRMRDANAERERVRVRAARSSGDASGAHWWGAGFFGGDGGGGGSDGGGGGCGGGGCGGGG
jgi:hypothetical protein